MTVYLSLSPTTREVLMVYATNIKTFLFWQLDNKLSWRRTILTGDNYWYETVIQRRVRR